MFCYLQVGHRPFSQNVAKKMKMLRKKPFSACEFISLPTAKLKLKEPRKCYHLLLFFIQLCYQFD